MLCVFLRRDNMLIVEIEQICWTYCITYFSKSKCYLFHIWVHMSHGFLQSKRPFRRPVDGPTLSIPLGKVNVNTSIHPLSIPTLNTIQSWSDGGVGLSLLPLGERQVHPGQLTGPSQGHHSIPVCVIKAHSCEIWQHKYLLAVEKLYPSTYLPQHLNHTHRKSIPFHTASTA